MAQDKRQYYKTVAEEFKMPSINKLLCFMFVLSLALSLSLIPLPSMGQHGHGGGGGGTTGEGGGGGGGSGGGLPGMGGGSGGGVSNTRSPSQLGSIFSDMHPATKSAAVNPYRGSTASKSAFMQSPQVFNVPESNDSAHQENVLTGMTRTLERLDGSGQLATGGLSFAPGMARVTSGNDGSPDGTAEAIRNLGDGAGAQAVGAQPGATKALQAARIAPATATAKKAALLLGNDPEAVGAGLTAAGSKTGPSGATGAGKTAETSSGAEDTAGQENGPNQRAASAAIATRATAKAMHNTANVPAYTSGMGFGLRK